MGAIVNEALAGFTVKYNTVQFGGSDNNWHTLIGVGVASDYGSMPPMYSFRAEEHWDEPRRALMWVDYTLFIRTIFFASSEARMNLLMRYIQQKLVIPRMHLSIGGLGSGLGAIANFGADPSAYQADILYGPFPGPIEARPLGQAAWEVDWSIKFSINPCVSPSTDLLAFTSFNFSTVWNNDFEGTCTRTISGWATIPRFSDYRSPRAVTTLAENTRGNILVVLPSGFRRVSNVWRESEDKNRLDFNIVDEQLPGDPFPTGVTLAKGSFGFTANSENGGLQTGVAALQMTLKTSPLKHRNLAGQIFLVAALSKQTQLQAIDGTGKPTINVIPIHFSITNGFWDDCRITNASVAWKMTKTLSECLAACNIYQPINEHLVGTLGAQDYGTWLSSLGFTQGNNTFHPYDNIGTSRIRSSTSDEVAISNICDNDFLKQIGNSGSAFYNLSQANLPSLTCPEVPNNGGWIHFDLDIRFLRMDTQTWHRKAAAFIPSLGQLTTVDPLLSNDVKTGGPAVSQSQSDEAVVEHHGYPETWIGLTFSGLRFKHKPFVPEIKSVKGRSVVQYQGSPSAAKWAFDVFGCPVWSITGWRIYRFPGDIPVASVVNSMAAGDPSAGLTIGGEL